MNFHFTTRNIAAVTTAVLLCSGAWAQGLEIAPLLIDTDEDEDSVLVLAALDLPEAAPLITGIGQGVDSNVVTASFVQDGLPKPSIILGVIEAGQEALFGIETLLPATVSQASFALDDLAAREALRASNPELFLQLINEGHLDPVAGELNRVLQIELARMNCYRSGIDGAWGRGSRRSVGEYFDQLASVSWDDPAPTAELFRAIVVNGEVDCPTPQATQVRSTNSSTSSGGATTTRRQQPRAAAPAAAPKPKPATSAKPKLKTGVGIGVFR